MARGRQLSDEARRGLFLVSPPFLYAILLLAVPVVTIILYSFWTDGYLEVVPDLTLENYTESLTDPLIRQLLVRSVGVAVTAATVLLAFPIAYYISFHVRPERKSLWLFLITIPFWTSYLIRVALWKVILGYNGVANSVLDLLGFSQEPVLFFGAVVGQVFEPVTWFNLSIPAIVITLSHAYAPFAILPIFVALEKIDRSLGEASRDLGDGPLMTFWRVTLPLAVPGVVAAVLIVFIPTIGDYVTPAVVGGDKNPMIANFVYISFLKLDNYPQGAALAMLSMLAVTLIALVFLWLNRRWLRVGR